MKIRQKPVVKNLGNLDKPTFTRFSYYWTFQSFLDWHTVDPWEMRKHLQQFPKFTL